MKFSELSEDQWKYINCFLPPQPLVGRKRADDRRTINGILYVLETGCKWEDMPRHYGSYVTAWRRLRRWSEEGVWFRVLCAICDTAYSAGKLSIDTVAVDSTLVDSKKVENSQATMVTKEGKASKFMHR
jgi:transposase